MTGPTSGKAASTGNNNNTITLAGRVKLTQLFPKLHELGSISCNLERTHSCKETLTGLLCGPKPGTSEEVSLGEKASTWASH